MDKVKGDVAKAMFYIRQTIENGWSRSMLLNFISADLHERQGKALTNFKNTLPEVISELAQEKVIRIVEENAWGAPLKVELRTEI